MTQTIRFYSVNRDGSENLDYGTVSLSDAGELDYANDLVREIMAPMVARVGPVKAFGFYNPWTNGAVCSHPVEPGPPS